MSILKDIYKRFLIQTGFNDDELRVCFGKVILKCFNVNLYNQLKDKEKLK